MAIQINIFLDFLIYLFIYLFIEKQNLLYTVAVQSRISRLLFFVVIYLFYFSFFILFIYLFENKKSAICSSMHFQYFDYILLFL